MLFQRSAVLPEVNLFVVFELAEFFVEEMELMVVFSVS